MSLADGHAIFCKILTLFVCALFVNDACNGKNDGVVQV